MEAITNKKIIKKPFRNLEVNYLDSNNIAANFRKLLTNYKVHYNKLRHYYWNNLGSDCHELNKEFEDSCQIIHNKIEMIDGKIYDFDQQPQMTIEDVLKNASAKKQLSVSRLLYKINDILRDFSVLHETMLKSVNSSFNITNSITEHLTAKFIHRLEESN